MMTHSPENKGGDKRDRILCAAEAVFAERGFFHAKVSEIARQAGVADGTIYLYFKNKDDLLISLFEDRMEHITSQLRAAVEAAGDADGQILAFVKTHLKMVREQPALAEVLTVELRQSAKFMKEHASPHFSEFLRLLAGIVAEGQKSGRFQDGLEPAVVARAIFGMIDELALAWLLGGREKFDIVRAADWVGSMIVRGLERSTT